MKVKGLACHFMNSVEKSKKKNICQGINIFYPSHCNAEVYLVIKMHINASSSIFAIWIVFNKTTRADIKNVFVYFLRTFELVYIRH